MVAGFRGGGGQCLVGYSTNQLILKRMPEGNNLSAIILMESHYLKYKETLNT
jgi:hypothetical protein